MPYVNRHDKNGECSLVGHKAEDDFSTLAEARGFDVSAASRYENMHKHIDFSLEKWGKNDDLIYMTVDVKSRKKTSRKDAKFNDDWIWLEFKNVNGNRGWLLGESTHIAFEREKEFVIVPRKELLNWAKQAIADRNGGKITVKCKAKNARDARYKYYTRWKREDLLTQVHHDDIIKGVNNIEIWQK